MDAVIQLIARAEALLEKIERIIPNAPAEPNWKTSIAFRWRKRNGVGYLQGVSHPHKITLRDIHGVDEQKKRIDQNTKQFVEGRTANNILLTGARGTGKSSLIKAVLNKFAKHGLRLIEVEKQELVDLPDIVDIISARPERYIIFCDDLSFEANDPGYKALKVVLDGSIAAASENVLIYATSNRRHLMPEYMSENLEYKHLGEEVHPSETVEEKISLSERFGLWLSFYPFDQDDYLAIAEHWVKALGAAAPDTNVLRQEALLWALTRSSRSGRVAYQFALDWAGRQKNV
ncbi:MAG: ATP-binding protein [Pseudomonadota bacterium]|nr:ATP-binding protein [Pseudomonadota bacterium]